MQLPVMPPLKPMLAKSIDAVPEPGSVPEGMLYEPKWDGFRCILFKDGDEVELGSRNERPLTRYFPEVVEAARQLLPARIVLDGEIVIVAGARLDFDALLNRIHPAASRVNLLAEQTPASFVAFDLLALDDEATASLPQGERRKKLVTAFSGVPAPMHLTPATTDVLLARTWFEQFEGAGLDGIVAKPQHLPYRPDQRAMYKIKHERTADCVVGGFRWHKTSTEDKPLLGSMLLGLYDGQGILQHVGVCGSFSMARRAELAALLSPLQPEDLDGHPWADWAETESADRRPGATSRWNAGKDLSWVPIPPDLVVEVAYDHLQGNRFRHTTQFRRWRTDRTPASCTYDQLEEPVAFDISEVLG